MSKELKMEVFASKEPVKSVIKQPITVCLPTARHSTKRSAHYSSALAAKKTSAHRR